MREVFATIKWDIEDILMLQPHWTRVRASAFLAEIESDLEKSMTIEGWKVIQNKLDMQQLND